MVVAKKYVLIKAFDGFPSNENIELQEENLAPLKDGGTDDIFRISNPRIKTTSMEHDNTSLYS